jgi:hypothetical protein
MWWTRECTTPHTGPLPPVDTEAATTDLNSVVHKVVCLHRQNRSCIHSCMPAAIRWKELPGGVNVTGKDMCHDAVPMNHSVNCCDTPQASCVLDELTSALHDPAVSSGRARSSGWGAVKGWCMATYLHTGMVWSLHDTGSLHDSD